MKNLVCYLLILTFPLAAHEFKSPKSQHIADQLIRSINQKLAEISKLEIAAGAHPDDITIDLNQAERYDSGRFGAILDARTQGKVLSITPRSQAYKLGLQAGDIIIEINDSPILLKETAWHKQLQYAENNSSITIKVKRNNQELTLGGTLNAKYTPQWQLNSSKDLLVVSTLQPKYIPKWSLGSKSLLPIKHNNAIDLSPTKDDFSISCGRVIVGRYLSKFSRHSGTAAITNIDGRYVNTENLTYQLAAGEHTLKVQKRYAKQNKDIITLSVEPNTNYYIGYVDNAEWEGGAIDDLYSGPSIIKTKHQLCQDKSLTAKIDNKEDTASDLVCEQRAVTGSRLKRTFCRSQEDIDKENTGLWNKMKAIDDEITNEEE